MPTWEVREGHVLELLGAMLAESVQCVVTSPPYWGLRDYGLSPQVWGGAREGCKHRWRKDRYRLEDHGDEGETDGLEGSRENQRATRLGEVTAGTCLRCGAWMGSLGLEPTPELYVQHLVEVLSEVFRVLRADGTLWLNLGDSYARTGGDGSRGASSQFAGRAVASQQRRAASSSRKVDGVPPKSLVGIPWRVALALQRAGVPIRAEVIWDKGNAMPEAVLDRPTRAHEQLFLFAKSDRYFYDTEAIREPVLGTAKPRGAGTHPKAELADRPVKANASFSAAVAGLVERRNKRSVWRVNTAPFPGAHFATFPPDLVVPCIRAGTSEQGCCAECGSPVERVVESVRLLDGEPAELPPARSTSKAQPTSGNGIGHGRISSVTRTLGWRPTCECAPPQVPCTVMDPFCGSGTTGEVALAAGRSFIGLELNPHYVDMSRRRLAGVAPLFASEKEAADVG